jgi:selenocysteine lyase/cysteine desulfurase
MLRYLDHSATSFPKPAAVAQAMACFLDELGGPYGRSGHRRALETSRLIFEAREALAERLGVEDSSRIVLTSGATFGLNLALRSLVEPGSRVLVCPMAHNAVMRPLEQLRKERGISWEFFPCGPDGGIEPSAMAPSPDVRLAIVTAESNVNGVRQPLSEIKALLPDVPLLVDAAQGDCTGMCQSIHAPDIIALTGHKSLLGPPGTGALYTRPGLELLPLVFGGTGSRSDSFEPPSAMPDRLEAGTPNTVGFAGLLAAMKYRADFGPGQERALALEAISHLKHMDAVNVFCAERPEHQGSTFSFNIEGFSPSNAARQIERRHGLLLRVGLHCAPAAHSTLGTVEGGGTVRVSFGRFQDERSVELLMQAVRELLERPKGP